MNQVEIKKIVDAFGPIRWIEQINGMPGTGWFLMEVTPCPPKDQRPLVVADIIANKGILVELGCLYHDPSCQSPNHKIENQVVKKVINNLKKQTFCIAVYLNPCGAPLNQPLLMGRPIAIAVDPVISYSVYPDHPHLNLSNPIFQKTNEYFPDSLCYMTEKLPIDNYERFLLALDTITIWLFRHQIWLATRKLEGEGIWIGPHEGILDDEAFAFRLDPSGRCRCGKGIKYADCHQGIDTLKTRKQRGFTINHNGGRLTRELWESWIHEPEQTAISNLRAVF